METHFSALLEEPPSFLSMVSMVGDVQADIIQHLVHAERPSPPFYDPAREIFVRALEGTLSYTDALKHAGRLDDPTERKCAQAVMEVSEAFLAEQPNGRVGKLESMGFQLPNQTKLVVGPIWLRHLEPKRLLVLHLWQKPLSDWQLSAAARILIEAIKRDNPILMGLDLDFISISRPDRAMTRRLRKYDWWTLRPLEDDELARFLRRFCDAWSAYKRLPPRLRQRRPSGPTLL